MIEILPTQYCSKEHPPKNPEDFIGGARECAATLKRIIEDSVKRGFLPIKQFYSGASGVGKTALAYYAQSLMNVSQFALYEFNGADLGVDDIRKLADTMHLTHSELFGDYRLIAIHEADSIPRVAQVSMLSFLDNLPKRAAVICTSNMNVTALETRFHRRFKFSEVRGASNSEIVQLLARWDVPAGIANHIASMAEGSVALALQEAEEWIQGNPEQAKEEA